MVPVHEIWKLSSSGQGRSRNPRKVREGEPGVDIEPVVVQLGRIYRQRVANSFLFAMRRQLIEWKFAPKSIYVHTDTHIMKVKGADVLEAEVVGDEFQRHWLNEDWGQWTELQQSPELAQIQQSAKERLAKSRMETSKGAGKGPHQ